MSGCRLGAELRSNHHGSGAGDVPGMLGKRQACRDGVRRKGGEMKILASRLAWALALACVTTLVPACDPSPTHAPSSPATHVSADWGTELLADMNGARAARHLVAFKAEARLANAAQEHSGR